VGSTTPPAWKRSRRRSFPSSARCRLAP
jgi:hypothetical protein